MKYRIYYHDKLDFTGLSIEDVVKFINIKGYVIYDEIEHLDNNYINIYCI